MKGVKICVYGSVFFALMFAMTYFAFAQDHVEIPNPLTATTLVDFIDKIIDLLFVLGVPISALAIVVGGWMFLFSGGEPKNVEKAKQIILYALIGLVIIVGAKGFIAFVITKLTK